MKQNLVTFFSEIYDKMKRNRAISLLIVVIILVTVYYFFFKAVPTTVAYQYATVQRGNLSSIVSATGQVAPSSQVDLKPKVNANIIGVNVKAGDRVRTGQVLFRLDATDAYKQVRDAKTALDSANIALEKLRNPKVIDVMAVKDAITSEEEAKIIQNDKVATAYRTLLNSSLQAIPETSFTSETAPTITGSYSGTTEGRLKVSVYQGGTSGYGYTVSGLTTGSGDVSTSVAQPIGDSGLFIKWNTSSVQTNWVIDIPNKQSSGYLSSYQSWQTASKNRDIANAVSDRNILSYKQKLADLTPSDDNIDVKSALLSVEQKKNSLLDANQILSNYVITAPFDGVMASVNVDIGSSAVMASSNSSAALGTIVTDKKLAQITLNETDIVKVSIGQKATVTFDAIDGLKLEGTVVEINTLGTVTSGVVSYKVKVAFSAEDIRILPNMSVSVDILTGSKDNVLFVPNQAIKRDINGYYVEKNSNDTSKAVASSSTQVRASSTLSFDATSSTTRAGYRKNTGSATRQMKGARSVPSDTPADSSTFILVRVPVTIGIQTDTQTEVVTGLTEGERVITKKTTSKVAGSSQAPSITSLFRPQQGRTSAPATKSSVR